MNPRNLSQLTDQELLAEAKKMKSNALLNAGLIGFFIGIVIYSIFKNTWGMLTLIPLYFAYKLFNKPKAEDEELKALLKDRGLK